MKDHFKMVDRFKNAGPSNAFRGAALRKCCFRHPIECCQSSTWCAGRAGELCTKGSSGPQQISVGISMTEFDNDLDQAWMRGKMMYIRLYRLVDWVFSRRLAADLPDRDRLRHSCVCLHLTCQAPQTYRKCGAGGISVGFGLIMPFGACVYVLWCAQRMDAGNDGNDRALPAVAALFIFLFWKFMKDARETSSPISTSYCVDFL